MMWKKANNNKSNLLGEKIKGNDNGHHIISV